MKETGDGVQSSFACDSRQSKERESQQAPTEPNGNTQWKLLPAVDIHKNVEEFSHSTATSLQNSLEYNNGQKVGRYKFFFFRFLS